MTHMSFAFDRSLPQLGRAARHAGVLALVGWHAVGMAQIGPSGPIGPDLPNAQPAPARRASPSVVPPAPPAPGGAQRTGNRVEVTGNTATRVGCARGASGSVSVNSVDIDRRRMEGETVIVQGRNSSDVRTQDCPAGAAQPGGPLPRDAQVNSIRVR